ncbi:tRNA (adenosine(37)-N6)-threonylcarbamoyltransferase complex ATPase subunit type 1 TsaE [Pikeienuella piscinae]|uniref:tRNA threonylcarbamoyladenosine biosynthesis protein TsaE n=1 Tax=Pikeienuella piscinae TaxID=2748098 RepID=A0A7L5BZG5_9RHOB|nr:tRNA (adenosine(37)-N6)-threonylcarbamoyltransferase complex ATPase subunit type 1 TsaE [Pikeienuella piscinae]QIE57122.1 tRNA (adenosine(37)-N6)-threonylcarbamoyltransferase complex ATPase subunit type 1 TsaE [Pikeienuella piscinae]
MPNINAESPELELAGVVELADDAATARIGAALGAALAPGDAALLLGSLGAGKTALARAAIAARLRMAGRPPEDIPSPTFTLIQVYEADAPIWHADLYRLDGEDEVLELGLDEAFADAIVFVEWPEKLGALAPTRRLELSLTAPAKGGRRLDWRGKGGGWGRVAAVLERAS